MKEPRTKDWTVTAKPTNAREKNKGPLGAGQAVRAQGESQGACGEGVLRTPRRTQRARMVRVAGRHRKPDVQPGGRAGPRAWLTKAGPTARANDFS